MTGVVALLEPRVQTELHRALEEHGGDRAPDFPKLLGESLAALTLVGQYPADLRAFALTLTPRTALEDLCAHRVIELADPERPQTASERLGWSLTSLGSEMATILAAAVPELSDPERREAEAALAEIVAEANRELGLNP